MNILYTPFSWLMKGCLFLANNNYLFALLFFALIIEIILLPLAIKQQKSSIMMAKIRPKEMAIREKYKGRNDRVTQQKMTMEIQQMYQDNNYNQFAGCLPLLIQLPIIFILFAIVRNPITYATNLKDLEGFDVATQKDAAVEYYEAHKGMLYEDKFEAGEYKEYVAKIDGYINGLNNESLREMEISRFYIDGEQAIEDLGDKINPEIKAVYDEKAVKKEEVRGQLPDYKIGPVNLVDEPDFGGDPWLLLIPLLVFLTSFISTKLTRIFSGNVQTDANGNPIGGGLFMEVGMPALSAVFAFSFSAAIGVYWIWRTLIGMLKAFIMAKALPIPKVTEEDIAAAKKEMKLAQKSKKKKTIVIEVDEDDDSYDDIRVDKENIKTKTVDVTQRTPRTIEMLSDDDEE